MLRIFIFFLLALGLHAETVREQWWRKAAVRPEKQHETSRIVDYILANKTRYTAVDAQTSVPWYAIAGIHNMEASGSFKLNLAEGSPLTGRSRDEPKGRPKDGKPPFTWEFAAVDALTYDRMGTKDWTSLDATLIAVEYYNGSGYAKRGMPSPYVFAATTSEVPGRYIRDHVWSSTAMSDQVGVGAIWKELERRKVLNLDLLRHSP